MPKWSKFAKLTFFDIFYELLSIQNVNVARFARNVEWDILGDFSNNVRDPASQIVPGNGPPLPLLSLSLPLHSLEDPLVKKATFIHILALVRLFSIHSLQRSPRKRPPLVPKQSTVSANFYPWPRQQKQPFDLFLPSNDLLHINKHKNKKIHCYQETFIHLWNK